MNDRKGGLCFINARDPNYMDRQIKAYLEARGIETYVFRAEQLAEEMGLVQSTNIALIGFASGHPRFPFPHDKLRTAIERVTPQRFRGVSLKIFDKAFLEGQKSTEP